MAYAVTNPPKLMVPGMGGAPAIWFYTSTDNEDTVDAAGYITNASDLGMRVGDIVFVYETDANLMYLTHVKTISSGAASLFEMSTFAGA